MTKTKPYSPNFSFARTFSISARKTLSCRAVVATDTTQFEIESKKHNLLRAIQDTQRGLVTTADQCSDVEEALVSLEVYNMGAPVDLVKLDGTWKLQYTSAPDILVLLEATARLSFFQVGQIFQKFECRDQSNGGVIHNVVRWSIPTLFEEQVGAVVPVSAKFDVVSVSNIYLQFKEISIRNIIISEEVQALVAPAILPRSFLSLQILQFIRTFKAQVPVTNPNPGTYDNDTKIIHNSSFATLKDVTGN